VIDRPDAEDSLSLRALVLPAFSTDHYDTGAFPVADPPDELAPWLDRLTVVERRDVAGAAAPLAVTSDGVGVAPTGIGKANAAATVTALFASPAVDLVAPEGVTAHCERYESAAASGKPTVAVGPTLCGDEFWRGSTPSTENAVRVTEAIIEDVA
jgi:purine nucleoside permease